MNKFIAGIDIFESKDSGEKTGGICILNSLTKEVVYVSNNLSIVEALKELLPKLNVDIKMIQEKQWK